MINNSNGEFGVPNSVEIGIVPHFPLVSNSDEGESRREHPDSLPDRSEMEEFGSASETEIA
jgi:hypothetical protein